MGTRNNPGKFDCYSRAEPDEPMFVLLGRDPVAAALVCLWMDVRKRMVGANLEKIEEARSCAAAMASWSEGREVHGFHEDVVQPCLIEAMRAAVKSYDEERDLRCL